MLETRPMFRYVAGQNGDSELLAWYLRLVNDGDLKLLFGDLLNPLAAFMKNYTEPDTILFYDADDKGWWIVVWFQPFMGGASWGVWVRPDRRGAPAAVSFVLQAHDLAFTEFPLLMFVTLQDQVVAQMSRLGYTHLGTVPGLFGQGQPGHVLYLDRDTFKAALTAWKEKINGRSTRRS